ncbi:hypothetical protein AAVH_28595 [Aphelenchoides avenae]|nr:hypothetical protein AAVH_28595 [Aphelenchus avenae]
MQNTFIRRWRREELGQRYAEAAGRNGSSPPAGRVKEEECSPGGYIASFFVTMTLITISFVLIFIVLI